LIFLFILAIAQSRHVRQKSAGTPETSMNPSKQTLKDQNCGKVDSGSTIIRNIVNQSTYTDEKTSESTNENTQSQDGGKNI
jgi:hypothetical protein